MPNMEATRIPVWITSCQTFMADGSAVISTNHHENCVMRPLGGKCKVFYKETAYPLNERSIVMLGRDTTVRLEFEGGTPGEYLLLRYSHTFSPPQVDLNHICTSISLIDSFYGQKKRFCIIHDRDCIYMTLGEMQHEWNNDDPEKDSMIKRLIEVLLLKLARSFHFNNQNTGIQHLSKARAYIQVHYNNPISLDEIAAAAGISRSYLTQLFRHYMNRSVIEYIQAVRCDHAAYLLVTTRFPIIDIAIEAGFNNRQHFARTFSHFYGLSPMEYRHQHTVIHHEKKAALSQAL